MCYFYFTVRLHYQNVQVWKYTPTAISFTASEPIFPHIMQLQAVPTLSYVIIPRHYLFPLFLKVHDICTDRLTHFEIRAWLKYFSHEIFTKPFSIWNELESKFSFIGSHDKSETKSAKFSTWHKSGNTHGLKTSWLKKQKHHVLYVLPDLFISNEWQN